MHCAAWAFLVCALIGLGRFVYDFQTLIAGGAAVVAAYYAARPVYRQLDMMRLQSDAVMRGMLLDRERDLRQALDALEKNVGEPLSGLGSAVYWEAGDEIDEERAFYHDQVLATARNWLIAKYRWRDSADVEAARAALETGLEALIDTLDDVHRPAHTEKVGEDYAMSDEDWTALLKRGEEAKGEILGKLVDARKLLSAMTSGIGAELNAVGGQLTAIDRSLAGMKQ